MKCNVINLVVGLLIVALLGLTGCGGGGSAASPASTGTANNLITSVGWLYENAAPDYSNNGQTCLFNAALYYSESIAATDIDSLIVSAPNGWEWTIPSTNSQFGTSSTGKPYISGQFSFGDNPHAFPLAGTWYFMLRLKNGQISTVQRILHEPGSSASATHQYLYTGEDWAPSTNSSQYIAALGRFPSQGYTLHYSAGDGGTITTTGLPAAMSSYLAAEPRAYNMVCWLYDANKSYLGYSTTEFSPQDHSRTSLITANGELLIVPASTLSSTGQIDLSTVKYLRFVFLDGAQYAPLSYSNADYRSISALVPVNSGGAIADPVAITTSFQSQFAKYTMSVPTVVKQGDVLPITFTVNNTSSSAINVVALPVRIYVNGVEIYFSTVGTYSGGVSVQPGETKTIMTSWSDKDNNGNIVQAGNYVLVGSCQINSGNAGENTDLQVDFTIQ
jgi:hypothetical protein